MRNKNSIVLQYFVLHYFSIDWIHEYYFSQKAAILLGKYPYRNPKKLMTNLHSIIINLLFLVRLAEEDSEIVAEFIPVIFDLLSNFETADFGKFVMDHSHWLYLYAEIRKKISISNSNELKRLWNQLLRVLTTEKQTTLGPNKRFYPLFSSIKVLELEGTTHSYHKLNKDSQRRVLMQWVDLECTYRYELERSRSEEGLREKSCSLARKELSRDSLHVSKTADGDEYVEDSYFAKAWVLRMRKWEIFPRSVTVSVIECMPESALTQLYTSVNNVQALWKSLHYWDEFQVFHVKTVEDSLSAIAKAELQSAVDLFQFSQLNEEDTRSQSRLRGWLGYIRQEVADRQTKYLNSIGIYHKTFISRYSEQRKLLTFFRERMKDYANYLTEYFRALILGISEANQNDYSSAKVSDRFSLLHIYQDRFPKFQYDSELKAYYTKSLYADSPVSFLYEEGLEIWQRIHSIPLEHNRYLVKWSNILSNIDQKLLQQASLSEFKLQTIAHFMDLLLSFDFPVLCSSLFISDTISAINKFIDIMAADPIIDVATQGINGEAISMIGKLFWFKNQFPFNVHRFGIFSMLHGRSEYAIISKSVVELYEQGNQLDSFLELLGLFVREGLPEMVGDYHVIEEALKQRTRDSCEQDDHFLGFLESALNLFLSKEFGEESIVTVLQLNPHLQTLLESIVFAFKALSINQQYILGVWMTLIDRTVIFSLGHKNVTPLGANEAKPLIELQQFELLNRHPDCSLIHKHVILSSNRSYDTRREAHAKKADQALNTAFEIYNEGLKLVPSSEVEEEINQYLSLTGLYFKLVEAFQPSAHRKGKQKSDSDIKGIDITKQENEQYILSLKEQIETTLACLPKRNHDENKVQFSLSREIHRLSS